MTHLDDLKNALSYSLMSAPYDPSGYTPEHGTIRELTEVVRAWEDGDVPDEKLLTIFRNSPAPNFDIAQWVNEQAAKGVYHLGNPIS